MRFSYCPNCGKKLVLKKIETEGMVPFCDKCNNFLFNKYNVAVSMIVIAKDQVLLVKQYRNPDYILVAGYVNQNESLEGAVIRELLEEIGLKPISICFNFSEYYEKSDTLMCNFIVHVNKKTILSNAEIDSYRWFSFNDALLNIKPNSLAKKFLMHYIINKNKFSFIDYADKGSE